MKRLLLVTNALSDMTRLRLLMALEGHELCVCQLVSFIQLADSTVSKHMSILRNAGLVVSRKQGRWVYYREADANASRLAKRILKLVHEHLAGDDGIIADRIRIVDLIREHDELMCQAEHAACTGVKPKTIKQRALLIKNDPR